MPLYSVLNSQALKKIKRYIDYTTQIGIIYSEVIELGYNTNNIELEIEESNTAIGVSPIGQPTGNKDDTFHEDRLVFEKLEINKGEMIPQYYTKQDKYLPGPPVCAPYSKQPNTNYMLSDEAGELNALINIYKAKKVSPRHIHDL